MNNFNKKERSEQKRILLLWELGSNLGHLFNFKYIAEALQEASLDVLIAAKELHQSERAFRNSDIKLVQAPVWLAKEKLDAQTLCMPDILLRRGYSNHEGLLALVKAWQNLYDLYKPDLVIFDYAPTALLAAKPYTFKKIVNGIGFGILTPGQPAENIFPVGRNRHKIVESEKRVLDNINKVASHIGTTPMKFVGDLYIADKIIINNIPELDLYHSQRQDVAYVGTPLQKNDNLPVPTWPKSKKKFKLFVYMSSSNSALKNVLIALANINANILVFIGNNPEKILRSRLDNIRFLDGPANLEILQETDLVIADGGHTVIRALMKGVPVLAAPSQLEQRNLAMYAEKTGSARTIRYSDDPASLEDKINALLHDERYKLAAQKLSRKYAGLNGVAGTEFIKNTCLDLLRIHK